MSIAQPHVENTNYSHSADNDLLQRLRIALSVKRRAGWHLVNIDVQNGIVVLSGIVPSYYDRQLITALVRHVAGVRGLDDQLAVGSAAIRQQVFGADDTIPLRDVAAESATAQQRLQLLPVLPHTLDDLVAAPTLVTLI